MEEESIKKITIHKVLTCHVDESVENIAKKLKEGNERRIFVVDEASNLIGVITTTDMVYKALCFGSKCVKMNASEVMVKDVKSVDLTENLEKALEIMNSIKSFNCPVTDNGKIIGVSRIKRAKITEIIENMRNNIECRCLKLSTVLS